MTLDRNAVADRFDVSRETMARFDGYVELLTKWNPRINLVSRDSLGDVWHRHIADSAQLWQYRPGGASLWLDLGAGGGLPGLVVAAFAADDATLRVRLVESDARKSEFLRYVIRELNLPAEVLTARIEELPPQRADVVSARALAPLAALLDMTEKHLVPGGIGLFPKGRTVHKEVQDALQAWRLDYRIHPSQTDPSAGVVKIGALDRV